MNADSSSDVHVVLNFRYVIVFFSFQVYRPCKKFDTDKTSPWGASQSRSTVCFSVCTLR